MKKRSLSAVLCASALSLSMGPLAHAESATAQRAQGEAAIPHCVKPLGTLAVRLPKDATNWWSAEGLSSPDTVVKSFVKQSGCFKLVDRSAAMTMAEEERGYASAGVLRAGANIGKGQVTAADYILVPTLLSKNSHASGSGFGALLGFVPGIGIAASAIASGISLNSKTADVSLSLVDVRSSEEVATEEGHAKKKDLSWGAAGGGIGPGALGIAGATGYSDTEIGQLIMLAYLDAYKKIVSDRDGAVSTLPAVAGSTSPVAVASAASQSLPAPVQESLTASRATSLHGLASAKSKVLGAVPAGSTLYPTGGKTGIWIEVTDEAGTRGWVSSLSVSH